MVRPVGEPPSGSPDEALPADGRSARAVRTRSAIVDALLELLEEGDLQPTATRIADRAGISLRLIYHHFGDLESLFRAAAHRQTERMAAATAPIDPGLPLDDRVAALVEQRSGVLEWITPIRRASLLQEPFSPELRAARDDLIAQGRAQALATFAPELAGLDQPLRRVTEAGLAASLSWGYWNDLREMGHGPDEARAVLATTVWGLLDRAGAR